MRRCFFITVSVVIVMLFMSCEGSLKQDSGTWLNLQIGGEALHDWTFIEGAWRESKNGVITAPENHVDENLAFFTKQAYTDFEVEFEFCWDCMWTNAGFIFRARDARHYYMVHFPVVGQQYRAEHFWGAISKVDETGFVEVLKMELIHGVSSIPTLWHKVRVAVRGNEIRVLVDGRPFSVVRDDTYTQPGYLGLATYCSSGKYSLTNNKELKSSFRNLRIRGNAERAPLWDKSIQHERNWYMVYPEKGSGCGNIVKTSNGELLITHAGKMMRSTDKGRTWSDPEPLPEGLENGSLYITREGLLTLHFIRNKAPFQIIRAVSTNNGKTWSESVQTGEVTFPPEKQYANLYMARLLGIKDGTLLMFAVGIAAGGESTFLEGRWYFVHPPPGFINVCLRSTDNGQSWSTPVNMDGPPYSEIYFMLKGKPCEISAAQTRDGSIISLARPVHSPFMWETWSKDSGKTWTPMARGPFPMYACTNAMITTTSGVILIGGRFPGIGVQISRDNGMTWKCFRIDTCCWANGAMYEVEPDVVLFIYGGKFVTEPKDTGKLLRGQLLRVTPEGLEPAD